MDYHQEKYGLQKHGMIKQEQLYLKIDFWKRFDNNLNVHHINRYINFIKSIQDKGERELDYFEKHHIIPKSFIENNEIIILTAREHFIAHWILSKCFSNVYRRKTVYALYRMTHVRNNKQNYKINGRLYENLRREFAECHKGELNPVYGKRWKMTDEQRKRISESKKGIPAYNKGIPMSQKQKDKISKTKTGVKINTFWITNGKQSKVIKKTEEIPDGWYRGQYSSEETRKKKSISHMGNIKCKHTEEFKRNLSERNCRNKGKVCWINNGIKSKLISKSELNKYLEKGFKLGRGRIK